MYSQNISEEELKNKVANDFFHHKIFNHTRIIGKIDFCISYDDKSLFHQINFLWAEAKKGNTADLIESFVQLILTIGKERTFEENLPPIFLGAFDCEKIAFLEWHEIQGVFSQNDFNWNVAPSNHESKEFLQLYKDIQQNIESKKLQFDFSHDKSQLELFIKENFTLINKNLQKIQITKNNFVYVYQRWHESVKPSISLDFEAEKPDILESDFYLADLLSHDNSTKEIMQNLRILLERESYKINLERTPSGRLNFSEVSFNDNQKAHTTFWAIYERPPEEEYWDYILERRDLLVPQDIRERKGSFFTPQIWVNRAQEYLEKALGEDYQDEYYIWDCAAGTGNLLANLTNPRNIFASTLDKADIEILKERIRNGTNLLENHIFQFDFLNDTLFDKACNNHQESFDEECKYCQKSKLPANLIEILSDEQKRKKLIIFINPPYAEASSYGGNGKPLVANSTKTYEKYLSLVGGNAMNELFAQFFFRIYQEIDGCILAAFSKLKYLNSTNFITFRSAFQAKFLKGFICPAYTFDNVKGSFPIGFLIWDTSVKENNEKEK
ncbi:hypothetical protein CQA53_08695 [Helicobacter didelphidarum]|uniref:Uncharacterized protein n=1 Tax=Helicobacter didelphidarum TaxID=2040648 RepID=A0A3D8IDI6_9HELI|nr:hypothetical protein [Helicobacter didelphidarum]RDU63212.1 hypothetical protein CQA53_08695 [Helicobacter didelphidarum]